MQQKQWIVQTIIGGTTIVGGYNDGQFLNDGLYNDKELYVLDASGLPNTASDYEKALEAIQLLTENVRRGPRNCATIKCAPRALIA